jgi:hypothetical protein
LLLRSALIDLRKVRPISNGAGQKISSMAISAPCSYPMAFPSTRARAWSERESRTNTSIM